MKPEKIETIIVLEDIIYPKNFEDKLNKFNKDSPCLDLFLNDYVYVIGGMTKNKKSIEEIEKNAKEMLFESFKGKILFIDGIELMNQILIIKERIKGGVPLRLFLPWFFSLSIQIKGPKIDKNGEIIKGTLPCYITIIYEYEKDKSYKFFIFFANDGSLLKHPYKEEFEKWCVNLFDKKIKKKINKKEKNNKRNPLDSKLRHECFKRDNYTCKECGANNKENVLHADHILPVSQGGKDELDNLQTLCEKCNLAKSNKMWVGGNDNV